jgi:hypothetical protein
MPDTNVQEFNLFVDHRFEDIFLASLGYAGEIGRHESMRLNANQPNDVAPGKTPTKYNIRLYPYIGAVYDRYKVEIPMVS